MADDESTKPADEAPEPTEPEADEAQASQADAADDATAAGAAAGVPIGDDGPEDEAAGDVGDPMANMAKLAGLEPGQLITDDTAGAALGEDEPASDEGAQTLRLEEFAAAMNGEAVNGIDLLADVELDVKIELGRTAMLVEDVLRLNEGAVVELDKLAGDPVDIYVNGRAVARGEVLVLSENFCVRINEILEAVDDDEQSAAG
ncbi:MAG: flagellar motor switch protein FliN [Planctomycetota bacterium]